MPQGASFSQVELMYDFERDQGATDDYLLETITGSATGFDILNKHGGWGRLDVDGDDTDAVTLGGERVWEADEGAPLIMEAVIQISDVSEAAAFIGFADLNNSVVYIGDENGTLLVTQDDVFGFMLEGEEDLTWQGVSEQANAGNPSQAVVIGAVDAADAVTQVLRIEANPHSSGNVKYHIDGDLVLERDSHFLSNILFCPVLYIDDRNTTYQMDVDYLYVSAPRS